MSNEEPETTKILGERQRPPRDRVFYANAVNWAFNEDQEAIFDFKLVMPEDFEEAGKTRIEGDGSSEEIIHTRPHVSLRDVPIEVRIYMPINQFVHTCRRMAMLWERLNESQEHEPQTEGKPPSSPEEK